LNREEGVGDFRLRFTGEERGSTKDEVESGVGPLAHGRWTQLKTKKEKNAKKAT